MHWLKHLFNMCKTARCMFAQCFNCSSTCYMSELVVLCSCCMLYSRSYVLLHLNTDLYPDLLMQHVIPRCKHMTYFDLRLECTPCWCKLCSHVLAHMTGWWQSVFTSGNQCQPLQCLAQCWLMCVVISICQMFASHCLAQTHQLTLPSPLQIHCPHNSHHISTSSINISSTNSCMSSSKCNSSSIETNQ